MSSKLSRRQFLRMAAGTGLGLLGVSGLAAQCVVTPPPQGASAPAQAPSEAAQAVKGSFNWMTWGDHYLPDQLEKIAQTNEIRANPTLFSDNSEALLKLQQVGGRQLDMVSGDALWVPVYHDQDLIEPLDLADFPVAQELYPLAREFKFWTTEAGYLAYPFGWSPILIAYNPKYITPEPDSWQVLWDEKLKGRIAMELQPFDVMAFMGKAIGAADPYDMTDAELEQAKQALKDLQPNILKFVEQNVEVVQLLANETIWLGTQNLGVEDRVSDAGGPEIKSFIPKEGTVGFIDGEMIAKDAANRDVARAFLNEAEKAEWIADNFLEFGRPLFNEKAYKLLDEQGYKERADRYLYNQPEIGANMTLKGPAPRLEEYINAFNEATAG
jgi:spermidine/putrescine transport system substrate-binding protein